MSLVINYYYKSILQIMLQGTCTILLHETCNIVILVSCKIVIREGGGCFSLKKKKKRQKSMACRWTTQIFQFCMVVHWYSLIYSLVDRDMTKTDFLLTISIQYQADKRWEWREISITGFLADLVPNSRY